MVRLLKSLKFDADKQPSAADQERITNELADLLQRAQSIGHAHASDAHESHAWGGSFSDIIQSARDIVSNFVARIVGWIDRQDAEDLTDEEIAAEVDSLAEDVSSVEVPSAISDAVMQELQNQDVMMIQWYAQPDACPHCQANADMGPVPIGTDFNGDTFPPAHPHCRCSLGVPGE